MSARVAMVNQPLMTLVDTYFKLLLVLFLLCPPLAGSALTAIETLDEAWWTGPVMAPTAATLPEGHLLFEPYLYDAISEGQFDRHGAWRRSPYQANYGSESYLNYGVTDSVTIGLIPTFGHQHLADGQSSGGIGLGDWTFQGQVRLTNFSEDSLTPTISLNIQETFPTGRYDRLNRQGEGFGSGAFSTALGVYGQSYFWLPNGRILRTRLDLTYSVSSRVDLTGASVYGTLDGFHGIAKPGDQVISALAFEYSATQNWVAALDLWFQRGASSSIAGGYGAPAADGSTHTGVSQRLYLTPAVEYNWSDNYGVIIGVRAAVAGQNAGASVTPVAAINCVF